MFRSSWHNDIATPIPSDVDPKEVIDILHNHGFLITLSPIVTRYEEAQSQGSRKSYDVWENIELLPFGLWKREIKFSVSFEDTADGVISWIHAPLNLTSQATYRVQPSKTGETAAAGQWTLDESIDSECSTFLKVFVETTMVATRKKMHASIMEKARNNGA